MNVFYMNPALKEMKFSVEIRRYGDINEILRRIEQTKRVKFEIKDRTINVYRIKKTDSTPCYLSEYIQYLIQCKTQETKIMKKKCKFWWSYEK